MPKKRGRAEQETVRPAKAVHASSWIFHDTPVRQEVHSALAKGMTLEEVPRYFQESCANLRKPSASELRKYFWQIVLQEEPENGADEVAEQPEPNAAERRIGAPEPAARPDLEGPVMRPAGAEEQPNHLGAGEDGEDNETFLQWFLRIAWIYSTLPLDEIGYLMNGKSYFDE